jgi:hypothetical protein
MPQGTGTYGSKRGRPPMKKDKKPMEKKPMKKKPLEKKPMKMKELSKSQMEFIEKYKKGKSAKHMAKIKLLLKEGKPIRQAIAMANKMVGK